MARLTMSMALAAFVMMTDAAMAQPYCREYTEQVYIGDRYEQAYGTACMQPDGHWEKVTKPVVPGYRHEVTRIGDAVPPSHTYVIRDRFPPAASTYSPGITLNLHSGYHRGRHHYGYHPHHPHWKHYWKHKKHYWKHKKHRAKHHWKRHGRHHGGHAYGYGHRGHHHW